MGWCLLYHEWQWRAIPVPMPIDAPTPAADEDFPDVPAATVARIRNVERHRVASLLEQDGDALVKYLSDPRDAVRLVAYLLRLEANRIANEATS